MLPLTTSRLTLRMLGVDDVAAFVAYRNDPGVARYQDWPIPYPLQAGQRLVEGQAGLDGPTPGEWVQLAIVHDGEVAGDLAVHLDHHGAIATVGYTLAPAHQGRGLARAALGALVDALIDRGVHRFVASVDPANLRSMRVVESVGFTFESLARRAVLVRGTWTDDVTYSMLAEDRAAWLARPRLRPTAVRLVEITADDSHLWGRLAVHHSQSALVTPVLGSYRNALLPKEVDGARVVPWFRGIEADGERVGFVMLAEATEHHREPYLWRFLIDQWHQSRGIGERALHLVLDRLRSDGHENLFVSYHEGVGSPRPFYERFGFVPTGKVEDGETEAVLRLVS